MTPVLATPAVESELLTKFACVIGMDEVGRGALAGPLAVGAVAITDRMLAPPPGLADSKLLSPLRRERLLGPIRQWASACSVGWATPNEISGMGVTIALRLAGLRALAVIARSTRMRGSLDNGTCVLLDGSHDWLSPSEPDLFSPGQVNPRPGSLEGLSQLDVDFKVVTKVKGDRDCTVIAAASNLAKVARDGWMSAVRDPGYDWASNKGYASASHIQALQQLGPSGRHRMGWKLPGVAGQTVNYGRKRGRVER